MESAPDTLLKAFGLWVMWIFGWTLTLLKLESFLPIPLCDWLHMVYSFISVQSETIPMYQWTVHIRKRKVIRHENLITLTGVYTRLGRVTHLYFRVTTLGRESINDSTSLIWWLSLLSKISPKSHSDIHISVISQISMKSHSTTCSLTFFFHSILSFPFSLPQWFSDIAR